MPTLRRFSDAVLIGLLSVGGCAPYGDGTHAPFTAPEQSRRVESWMLPKAKDKPLIYISMAQSFLVYVYTYEGHLVGELDIGTPQGECVDKAGDVWITDTSASRIVEYSHGGTKPIETLADPGQQPAGCSVDLKNGDLAVANICNASSCGNGNVAIYAKANGTPRTYFDPRINHYYACAYDATGNLLVDGRSDTEKPGQHEVFYAQLLAGTKNLQNVTIPKNLKTTSNVQWTNDYYAIRGVPKHENVIYHISIAEKRAKIQGSTSLGRTYPSDFAISGHELLTLSAFGPGSVSFWHYPSGKYIRMFMLDNLNQFPYFLIVSAPPRQVPK